MRLYYCDILSSYRACAVARHLKAPVTYTYLDFAKGDNKTPDYLAINPNGKVPTLVNGSTVLWESDAILCYLSDAMDAGLWPHDDRQIDILRWFSWNLQHFARAGGALYFEHIVKKRFDIGAPDPAAVDQALGEFRRYAAVLDDHLAGKKWLVGDSLTVADFSVAMMLPFAEGAKLPLDGFRAIRRWNDRLNEIESWREPYPPR